MASFLASLWVVGVEVREARAVPGLGMGPNGISGEAVTGELVAGGLQSGMLPDLGLTDHALGHLLLFDRDDGGPLAPVDISAIQQAGVESFHSMGPEGVVMPTGFTGLKVGQEVLPEIDPALRKEDDWMNTLVPEQMGQDDEPEMVSDSDSGEESDEDADEEGRDTAARRTLPNGIGSYVAQMSGVALLQNAQRERANAAFLQNIQKEKKRKPLGRFGGQVKNMLQFFQKLESGTLAEAVELETAGKLTVSELCAMAGLDGEQLEPIADRSGQKTEDKQDVEGFTEQEWQELQELE